MTQRIPWLPVVKPAVSILEVEDIEEIFGFFLPLPVGLQLLITGVSLPTLVAGYFFVSPEDLYFL